MKILLLPLLPVLALLAFPGAARAQLAVAEDLLVNLDFTTLPEGRTSWVVNPGSAGGVFKTQDYRWNASPVVARVGGIGGPKALILDGNDDLFHSRLDSNQTQTAPAGIVGLNPTRSIEIWALNPIVAIGEYIVSLQATGVAGTVLGFGFGSSSANGAVSHGGGTPDLPWFTAGGAPAPGVWHHLVYTFDGTTTRVYTNGVLRLSETLASNSVNTVSASLKIGAASSSFNPALAVGRVRIHDGVLSAADVLNNYNLEKTTFVPGTPRASIVRPRHRYSFTAAAAAAPNGTVVPDSENGADGVVRGASASFLGTALRLQGGSPSTAAYLDLPNGILSTNGVANGGSGEVTFEGWVTVRTTQNWARFFDFGSNSNGEITGPGPGTGTGFNGLDGFMFSSNRGSGDLAHKRVGIFNADPVGGGYDGYQEADVRSNAANATGYQFAITWNERTGRVRLYEYGALALEWTTNKKLSNLRDVNNWLGRSNFYADSNGTMDWDEFRIYNRALEPAEVLQSYQNGPDTVGVITPASLTALDLQLAFPTFFPGAVHEWTASANYANVAGLDVSLDPAIALSSSNPSVVQVLPDRRLKAVGLGSAVITAQLGAVTDTQAVNVVAETATLEHRYTFDANLQDSVGTAHGVSTGTGAPIVDGEVVLGSSRSVQLPSGLLAGDYAVSVEAWADFRSLGSWCRLFDFGEADTQTPTRGRHSIFLSPRSADLETVCSFSPSDPTGLVVSLVRDRYPLDGRANVHMVCVFHPRAGILRYYQDGLLFGEVTNVVGRLEDIRDTTCFLGRSLWSADAFLNADIQEFRVWDGVMTPQMVAMSHARGTNGIPPATTGSLGSVRLEAPSPLWIHQRASARLLGDFANIAGVPLAPFGVVTYTSSDPDGLAVAPDGTLTARRPGTYTLTGTHGAFSGSAVVVVERPTTVRLWHRYPFNGNCDDIVGGQHGTLVNRTGQSTYVNGELVLANNGTQTPTADNGDYVDLPDYMLLAKGAVSFTVEAWTTWRGPSTSNWQRVFDFGNSNRGAGLSSLTGSDAGGITEPFWFVSPRSSGGNVARMYVRGSTNAGASYARGLSHVSAFPLNQRQHVVSIVDANNQRLLLYVNGVLVDHYPQHSSSAISDVNAWLGRSQYNDPYYSGSLDEVRIYTGALTPAEIEQNFQEGPNPPRTSLVNLGVNVLALTNGTARVSWPLVGSEYIAQYSDYLEGGDAWFQDLHLPITQEGQEWVVYDTPANPDRRHYRLRKGP